MSINKILVCPESDYVEDEILYLQTSWDGEIFQLVDPYVTFESSSTFTLATYNSTKNWDGKLEYSTDTENWSVWDGTSAINAALYGEKYSIFLRGTGNTVLTGNDVEKRWVLTGSGIAIHGDVGWLLNYKNSKELISSSMGTYCCAYMFYGCTAIVDPLNLVYGIPASACYYSMYDGCTSLESSALMSNYDLPSQACDSMYHGCTSLENVNPLPARRLDVSSYSDMFSGCVSLESAPELTATQLDYYCYQNMFLNCTSLKTAPRIYATAIDIASCRYMFSGCTSLESSPALAAQSIGSSGCQEMFKGCTSLTSAPEIQATTLGDYSCREMFYGCTSLVIAPAIQATTVGTDACRDMFKGCTSLTTPPPNLKSVGLQTRCYRGMFYGCTELLSMPIISARTLANNCCTEMFYNCSKLVNVTPLLATVLDGNSYYEMFRGCSSLATIPPMTIEQWAYGACIGMFQDCISLTSAMDLLGLVYRNGGRIDARWCCNRMFRGCTGILTVPRISCETIEQVLSSVFFDCTSMDWGPDSSITILGYDGNGKIAKSAFESAFRGCTSLTRVEITWPESNDVVVAKESAFSYMFFGCSSLQSTIEMPNNLEMDTTSTYGYTLNGMYRDCTSIVEATVGWNTVNRYGCYQMFQGCTSLEEVTGSLTADTVYGCYMFMFYGCTSLTVVPEINPASGVIEEGACRSMFYGCSSLVVPPALPATTIGVEGYASMFQNCFNLMSLPELPATSIGNKGYNQTFYRCQNIKISETQAGDYVNEYRMPSSGTGSDGTDTFLWMFGDTAGTFRATPTINTTYYTSNSIVPANPVSV